MNVIPIPRRRPDEDGLVSADWIADRWGVHRETVYRIPAMRLPYLKLGPKTRRYRLSDVIAYEQQQTVRG